MNKLKKYIGEISILVGTMLTSYNILNISFLYEHEVFIEFNFDDTNPSELINGVAYYYNEDTIMLITLGITLIVFGILYIKRSK